jgi:hypothetical protein
MGLGPQIGGNGAALNITAAVVLKATPGTLFRVTVSTIGSAGALTLNDNTALTGNVAANQIVSIPFGSLTAGQVITLEWPCAAGIVVSAVTTGGVFAATFS